MLLNWQRLDRENSQKMIENVKSSGDPGLFSPATSEVQRAYLPFYRDYMAYKLTNYASLPSFTFEYLGDGQFFQHLDGTETPIYAVNDKGTLKLNELNVAEYLSFYFKHVSTEDGDVVFVKDPHDMPLLDSLDSVSMETLVRNHQPPEVEYSQTRNVYVVKATLYFEGQLIRATINVNAAGRVSITDQTMIMTEIMQPGARSPQTV